jgi:undecaprenyl diphosphate synthase
MSDVPNKLPVHVAVIMDGNGRWARARRLPRTRGHIEGAEKARAIVKCCVELGIPWLTLYTFSTENWDRPAAEVSFLMRQLRRFLVQEREELIQNDIRFLSIGRIDGLPGYVRKELDKTQNLTRDGKALTLLLALNYGARSELVDAFRKLAGQVRDGLLSPEDVDEERIGQSLYTAGVPDPDLLIRTGGECRVSNFLLWQISYTELYMTDVLWPDFGREEFLSALREFAGRERRFGRTSNAGALPVVDCRKEKQVKTS